MKNILRQVCPRLSNLKRIATLILSVSLLHSSAFAECGPYGEGQCGECGPHWSGWILDDCPSLNNTPGINPSSYACAEVGSIPVPSVTAPTYSVGHKHKDGTYDCTSNIDKQNATISYSVGNVQWDPPLGTFITGGLKTSTAYVIVTGIDPLCPAPGTPGRVDIGTCTWNIASPDKNTFSISLPSLSYLEDALDVAATASTFIKDITLEVTGTVSKETGQKCCNEGDGPSNYAKYSGSVEAKLKVELVIPGTWWGGRFDGTSPVEYSLGWDITLGPTIALSPSGTASISGTYYDNPNCTGCVTTELGGNCGISLSYGATAKVWGRIFENGHWYTIDVDVNLSITGSASTSVSGSVSYNGEGCSNPGVYNACITLGQCTAAFNATCTISGFGFSFEKSVQLWQSSSNC